MKTASFISYVKQRGHILLSLSGMGCLILSLGLMVSSRNENDRRYSEMLDHFSAMKETIGALTADTASKHARLLVLVKKKEGLKMKQRKKREVTESENRNRVRGGAVYIRWGRKVCPENDTVTELVYERFGTGSWYEHYGGATNLQCLPKEPIWGNYTDKAGGAYIYGMEFQEALVGLIDTSNLQTPSLANNNVPCAVCRSKRRTSVLMVPAKFNCYHGWHLEYHGYLMAGAAGHKSGTQYICIDKAPEADTSGFRDENGALLYRVTAQCGSLPCPDYVSHRELACAVCTK